jgi:hypothetical protein
MDNDSRRFLIESPSEELRQKAGALWARMCSHSNLYPLTTSAIFDLRMARETIQSILNEDAKVVGNREAAE